MFCQYCGRQIDDDSRFCDYCGRPQYEEGENSAPHNADLNIDRFQRKQGMGIGATIGIAVVAIVVTGIAIGTIVSFAIPRPDNTANGVAAVSRKTNESDDVKANSDTGSSTAIASVTQSVVALKDAGKGDLVAYGKYKQNSGSSEDDIEWIVLEVKEGHALLLSAKALDCRPISSSISTTFDVNWAKSDIREWLNGTFLDSFTEVEANGIDTTDVEQSNVADGKTQDKVFLLSKAEFTAYVAGSWAKAQATNYAQEQGANTFDDQGTTNWWLRDYNPDRQTTTDDNNFLNVFYDGTVNDLGYRVTTDDIAIRPAMWVSLDGKGTNKADANNGDTSGGHSTQSKNDTAEDARNDTVTLVVEAADGSTLTGTVRRGEDGFVIADSSSREYTMDELLALNLSDAELCIAWNEQFARQGYHFKNPGLLAYFQACDWYVDTGNESNLSGIAEVNNDRLRQIADGRAGGYRWKNLAAS